MGILESGLNSFRERVCQMSVNNNRAKELRILVRVSVAHPDQGFLLESHWLIFLMSTSKIFLDLFPFPPLP